VQATEGDRLRRKVAVDGMSEGSGDTRRVEETIEFIENSGRFDVYVWVLIGYQ
jgi:hypothetical protein